MRIVALLLVLLPLCGLASEPDATTHTPRLLLTARRLRRLQLDYKRQTVRWTNFENRINSVPDSPERGFELALYYAVTRNETEGREAIQWALAHLCDRRQVALVLDWCGDLVTPDERAKLAADKCTKAGMAGGSFLSSARDDLFLRVAAGQESDGPESSNWKGIVALLERGQFRDPESLYAAIEMFHVAHSEWRSDMRDLAPQFFQVLPTELLLSLKPEDTEHPNWVAHIAALSLVALDPNLTGSQYLQGWAMEDRQMLQNGPGVAYELLWADPYLPGIGYQNLDPWVYDPNGRFFGRTGWEPEACWVGISRKGLEQTQCPAAWSEKLAKFGHLMLLPASTPCTQIPARTKDETIVLWKLPPQAALTFKRGSGPTPPDRADTAGMWRAPADVEGRVCVARRADKP